MGEHTAENVREAIGARALRYGYIGVDRDNIIEIVLSYTQPLEALLRAECWAHHSNEGPHGIKYEPSPCQVAKRAAHIGSNEAAS
jgi:hypothetical protein